MAKKMAYTDSGTRVVHAESVWLPLGVYSHFSQPDGKLDFLGYATQELATLKLMHIFDMEGGEDVLQIATKSYNLSADQMRQFALSPPNGATLLDALSNPAYDVAMSVLDTDPITRQPSTEENAVSFFDGAVDVDLLGG